MTDNIKNKPKQYKRMFKSTIENRKNKNGNVLFINEGKSLQNNNVKFQIPSSFRS